MLLLLGCRPATPPASEQTPARPATVTNTTLLPATPTMVPGIAEVRNAQYQLGATNGLQIVQLTDGKFEQGSPGGTDFTSVNLTNYVAAGDLNGDGANEVAALVSENYGGSGVFVFLAVYSKVNDTLTFQASTMVDDRPQLNALSIENGEAYVDAVIHDADDPMCCPTLRSTRHYRLADNLLDMTDYTTFTPDGKPRTITIESPTPGGEVFSSIPLKGNVAVAPFENTLSYSIKDVSGIELSAGSVPVTAPDLGAPGTFDTMLPLGNILSGTVLRLEVQDLSAADDSLLAMDSVELVVK